MKPQVPSSIEIDWVAMSSAEVARFSPQIIAGLQWVLKTLDEAERMRKLPRTQFDQPVQERIRRAS